MALSCFFPSFKGRSNQVFHLQGNRGAILHPFLVLGRYQKTRLLSHFSPRCGRMDEVVQETGNDCAFSVCGQKEEKAWQKLPVKGVFVDN